MRTILFLFSLLFENIKEIYNTKTKCYPYKAHPNVLLERLGNMPTYKNGSYAARLDMSECNAAGETDFVMVDDARNISDHRPLSISIQTGCNTTSILHNNQRQQLGRQFIASSGMTLSSSSTTGKSSREFYLIRALTKSYQQLNTSEAEARINSMHSTLCCCMLKATRRAEQRAWRSAGFKEGGPFKLARPLPDDHVEESTAPETKGDSREMETGHFGAFCQSSCQT